MWIKTRDIVPQMNIELVLFKDGIQTSVKNELFDKFSKTDKAVSKVKIFSDILFIITLLCFKFIHKFFCFTYYSTFHCCCTKFKNDRLSN